MLRRLYLWLFLLSSVSLVCTGCISTASLPSSQARGSLTVKTTLPATFQSYGENADLLLTLTQNARRLQYRLPLNTDHTVSFFVDSLTVGMWQATLQMMDDDGDILYEARERIAVTENETSIVPFQLVPNMGTIEMYIDISQYPEVNEISQVRFHLDSGGYSTARRENGDTTLYIQKEVQPKSYDYRIALYNSADRPEIVYTSPWESLTVFPGKTITVYWSVSSGALELIGHITPLPKTPRNFRVQLVDENTVRFMWEANDDVAIGFRIYQRQEPFGPYRLVDEVPANVLQLDIPLTDDIVTNGPFVITSFSEDNLESPRSETVLLNMPKEAE